MVEKDTTEFSRESFKEKILRQLEESNRENGVTSGVPTYSRKNQSETFTKNFSSAEKPANAAGQFPANSQRPQAGSQTEPFQSDASFEAREKQKRHEFLKASSDPYHFEDSAHEHPLATEIPETSKTFEDFQDFENQQAQNAQQLRKINASVDDADEPVKLFGAFRSADFSQATEPELPEAKGEVAPEENDTVPEKDSPLTRGSLRERLLAQELEESQKAQEMQDKQEFAPATHYSRTRAHAAQTDVAEQEFEDENPEFITDNSDPAPVSRNRRNRNAALASDAPTKKSYQKKPKKKHKNTAGKIIAVIVLLLILAICATGWYGYNFLQAGVKPLDPNDKTVKAVNIPAGSSSKQIGDILQRQGIIKNGMIFQYFTKFKNYTGFKSGYYNLAPNMTLASIATQLEKGGTPKPVEPVLGKVTIPEGYTLDQIAQQITKNADVKNGKTPFTTSEFMKVVQDPTFIAKMQATYPDLLKSLPTKAAGVKYQLEGYLFPATYEYTKKSTVQSMIESMIAAMNTQLKTYYGQIATDNLSVNQVLSLASIVEKEANNDDDRRNVMGVFNNRMAAGMALQSNTTILYAEGKLGTKTSLKQDSTVNTQLDSPYNLYLHTGTGPGPIDSPSLSSIKAVLNPAQNSDYYFVADVTTGKVYFAQTLDEQNANVQKYVNSKLN